MDTMKIRYICFFVLCLTLAACSGGDPNSGSDAGVNPCEGVTCSDHGYCVEGSGGARCECETGYHTEGLSCIEDGTTGPCYEIDCSAHGTCVDVGGTPECRCDAGYHAEGLTCVENSVDPCLGITCSGHGQCIDNNGSPECQCDSGYHAEGLTCVENSVDPCQGITCSGHGQCTDNNGAPVCLCDDGYHTEGLNCVADADPCQGVTCSGHGQCVNNNGVAECDCDQGYEADGLTCVETLCACRERTKVDYSFCQYAQRCSSAADCCPDPATIAPLICNQDYPYLYSCSGGHCETLTCENDAHCSAYFQVTQQNSPGVWVNEGCLTSECSPYARWCSYRETCTSASDCCPTADSIAPYVCQADYPYIYGCQDGFCKMIYCTQDSHCQRVGAGYDPLDGWAHLGCVDNIDPCTGERWYGMCTFKQTCNTYQDCCPENTGNLTCGADYPYLYECDNNLCESEWCTSDGQCSVYYQQIENANPGKYENLGCVEY